MTFNLFHRFMGDSRLLRHRDSPQAPTKRGITLKEAFDLTMRVRDQWIQSKDKATLGHTYNGLGLPDDTPMATFTRDGVRQLKTKWLADPGKRKNSTLSASTVNARLSMLSVMLEACDLPPHTVKHMSTKGNGRTRRLDQHDIRRIQSWLFANSRRHGALTMADLITVALDTGARQGELLGLLWKDVGATEVTLRDTKNGLTRICPLPPSSQRVMQARISNALEGPFTDLQKSQLKTLWAEMRADIGLAQDEEFVFHMLRHEAGTRMAEGGVNSMVIKKALGHESIVTTEKYINASVESVRDAQLAAQVRGRL